MSAQERSKRCWASTCCTNSRSATPVGSAPTGTAKASASECAASVDSTRVRFPARADATAVPAAAVVLPTPPLPVKRMTRTVPCRPRPSGQRLDALLEPLQRGVDDDLLGLALEHADHGDRDVHRESVGDLGAAVTAVLEEVGAVHRLEHLALDEAPGDPVVAVPVVGQRVGVLDRAGVELEVDLLGALADIDRLGLLHTLRPARVGLEVRDHAHHRRGRGVDDDARGGLLSHAGLLACRRRRDSNRTPRNRSGHLGPTARSYCASFETLMPGSQAAAIWHVRSSWPMGMNRTNCSWT